ncbi:hypothetical protein [Pelagovum pacificum]|uniref:Transporter n=1 Tax=Pelagovum pacificum TaxID=2588711 RepID=A0A5C5G9A2_9RHOB|nr:hypothetical protein [Pelagovum pacificum]QQA42218.1 hypothetical protein I8N54_15690 [Pelagovum pacificum]TNY31305.1 hypothetical protein FHY64_14880 [Pelagovum pacificum]
MPFHALVILFLTFATSANAGPWLREKGAVFLSFGANVAISDSAVRPVHWDPTVFLEYGLTERLTVGFDLYIANGDEEQTAGVFARYPLREGDLTWPVSATVGYGLRHDRTEATLEEILRFGVSTGRGLPRGWVAIDAAAIQPLVEAPLEAKLDVTWGREVAPRMTTILQLQTGIGTAGDFYAKAAPSVLLSVNERLRFEVGAVQALTGDLGTGLRIAAWLDF